MRAVGAALQVNVPVESKPVVTDASSDMGLAFLKVISDKSSSKIMRSAVLKGKSVEEICSKTGIPTSTAYRKIRKMTESGLIFIERVVVTEAGKKQILYRAAYSRVAVKCDVGSFIVESTPNWSVPDIRYRLWHYARNHPEHQL